MFAMTPHLFFSIKKKGVNRADVGIMVFLFIDGQGNEEIVDMKNVHLSLYIGDEGFTPFFEKGLEKGTHSFSFISVWPGNEKCIFLAIQSHISSEYGVV
jgi:hypothetical protein